MSEGEYSEELQAQNARRIAYIKGVIEDLEQIGKVYGIEEHSHYDNALQYAIEELRHITAGHDG